MMIFLQGPKYFPDDQLTTRDERFFTAEIIRECILKLYKDEVPYSCEVVIESFEDKSSRLSIIDANIMVGLYFYELRFPSVSYQI
jgi:GTP-binding protein Era